MNTLGLLPIIFIWILNSFIGIVLAADDGSLQFLPQAALTFPQPVEVGVEVLQEKKTDLRLFVHVGYFRYPFFGGDKALSLTEVQTGIRYFPWTEHSSHFFTLLSLGYRFVSLATAPNLLSSLVINNQVLATNASVFLSTFYIVPGFGAEFPLSKRLRFSFDLGVQVPWIAFGGMALVNQNNGTDSSSTSSLQVDSDSISRIAWLILPQITFFRLTWLTDSSD